MSDLIKRTYRVTKEQDKKVKRLSSKKSESSVIRDAIDKLPDSKRPR